MSEMQRSSGDKKSPWKIPLLMLLSDIIVPLLYVRVASSSFLYCVLENQILWEML